jgi:hypothetical protein
MPPDPWLTQFKLLHERARKGTLTPEETQLYNVSREQLAQMLAKVQGLNQKPGETARQTFRVAVVLPVELTLPEGALRAVTLDVGRGGFASILQKLPEQRDALGFVLKLPGGGEPLAGRVRVVESKKQIGNFRVSFAFIQLGEKEADLIERVLLDSVLARLGV